MKKEILFLLILNSLFFSCNTKKTTTKNIKETPLPEVSKKEIIKYVTAKNGLRFRETPKGKVIGKFAKNTALTVSEKTGITQEITDNGKTITGEWLGVKHKQDTVYVFDAFLADTKKVRKEEKPLNPIDNAMFSGYIITPGNYHGDEIPDNMSTDNWWGIFIKDGTYSVEKTTVSITNIHDAIIDNEGDTSGKKITANHNKSCYLLMNNINYLTEQNIDTLSTKPIVIHPKKPYSFQFNNNNYTLSSTAKDYEPLNQEGNFFAAEGYKLYLEKKTPESSTKQLLLFERFFDDNITTILFIGDIDGDTIPDFLIDTANKYGSTAPTLYLSKEANKEEILKIVSLHYSTGC